LFREQLARHGLIDKLFQRFGEQPWASGLMPKGGQIVEHVFGDQRTRQGNILARTKGKLRAAVKIGLMNLTYNMRRLEFLLRPQSV
jgi:hypothetical protein